MTLGRDAGPGPRLAPAFYHEPLSIRNDAGRALGPGSRSGAKDMGRTSPKVGRRPLTGKGAASRGLRLERSPGVPEAETSLGRVIIADEVIATIAGLAATECYGVVGMAARRLKDGIAELLGRENASRGVEISFKDGGVRIDLNVIVGYGTRISEVAHNVSRQVRYRVEQCAGMPVWSVNINVQGVRAIGER